MDPADLVDVVSQGLTHDPSWAIGVLTAADPHGADESVQACTVFLLVLACRFDEALDAAHLLAELPEPSRLVRAATDIAVAVCAGEVTTIPAGEWDESPLGELTAMLEVEAAMSSGLIASAAQTAGAMVDHRGVETAFGVWNVIALARARCFEGQFTAADALIARALSAPLIDAWPQLHLLASGARIFVDAHLGRVDDVSAGLDALRVTCPDARTDDYVFAGAHVLAAFGASTVGLLAEAAGLVLRGGGGEHLAHLQLVDRLYGYEILVEAALARGDLSQAHAWSERAASLPIGEHRMASAALGRLRARLSVADQDTDAGIRESADSGMLAALVGSDLEVIRARIIESSARVASGDRIRGIEELEEAARRAGANGSASIKRWAEKELHLHGRRLRNVPGHGWDALSATQQSIARLAAAGLRNREIAAALWISEKTVESHVAAVLEALGTTNRVGIGRELGGATVDPLFGLDLTARQREVAVLVAEGHSNSEISSTLGISEKTVEKHVAGLFDRLGVRTRSAVAARVRGARETSP